ncbi:MAG: ClpXP protease specificity-enhancing factor SspB, partial [Sphingomonadaceae bacterium]|nr:ClpXP protease specificity-enhancing factor SspB [Sphingomonadaceae bacterium]
MTAETPPPESLIPYDDIVQEALRSVVRRVLGDIEAAGGLPGSHHFYIAFKTRAPGVDLPKHLHERYPDEMTIVIQHRYWDLQVGEERFSIGLSFNQVPAKLTIPYSAVTGFVDPAVNFALQFQPPQIDDEPDAD